MVEIERKSAEIQAFVERFRYKATKARQAQSRVKQLEKMKIPDIKRSSRISPKLKFEQERPSGRTVITSEGLGKQYGKVRVLKDVCFKLERGEKMAVIGPNGIGKSTLLKILLNHLDPDEGTSEWGYETRISYFAQDHHDQLKGQISAYDWLYQLAPQQSISTIRGLLGKVLLSGDEALKSVSSLSGGEAARLLFARMMLEKKNVMVMDEPTNHLDLEGVEGLAKALIDYPGTVIVVSHDRHFVSRVATRILELTERDARDFSGTYEEFLEHYGDDYLSHDQPLSRTHADRKKPSINGKQQNHKQLKRLITRLDRESRGLETVIEEHEVEIGKIDTIFSSEDYFKNTDPIEIQNLQSSKNFLKKKLKESLEHWETLSNQLEEARSRFPV